MTFLAEYKRDEEATCTLHPTRTISASHSTCDLCFLQKFAYWLAGDHATGKMCNTLKRNVTLNSHGYHIRFSAHAKHKSNRLCADSLSRYRFSFFFFLLFFSLSIYAYKFLLACLFLTLSLLFAYINNG